MKNNMLIKKENISIFRKILNFVKKIFDKKEKFKECNTELYEIKQDYNIKNSFDQKRNVAELQRKYESNVIREEDLTETEKNDLNKLYKEQIATIENNIQVGLKELDFYKQRIIVARKKAKNNS